MGKNLALTRNIGYYFLMAGPIPAALRVRLGGKETFERPETFCTQLETRVDFFYFFARNPLKSPDSDE
jgi:hypothetical protein